ncbi:MAG: LPS export ABC transporter periplasmic protein LptC [Candidatus Omnitrophota bacterium]
MKKAYFFIIILFISAAWRACFAAEDKEAQQEVQNFSFVQYQDKGAEKWKLSGRTAQVEDAKVNIEEISLLSFGTAQALKLKAREGSFNKEDSVVHLENNVVAAATDGTTLSTDYLDWNAETRNAVTDANVNIKRADLDVSGKGAVCNLEEKTAELKEDINVSISSPGMDGIGGSDGASRTTITCKGPLELNYKKNRATFYNAVKVEDKKGSILADRMDVYFSPDSRRVRWVIAKGNVRIINGENITYSEKAIYLVEQGRVILPDRPKLIIKNDNQ